MAKGIGLIGNFRGKVGNMVGYNLKDSNNKQTQGVRVYQPVVKNPKTYGQAEQRAKLAPINATYRALKMIIDRGQEGKAYGNKSRLAWLSDAMKAFNGGWFEKGADITAPALVPLTKGSLSGVPQPASGQDVLKISATGIASGTTTTIGALATAILAAYPALNEGDQITLVQISSNGRGMDAYVESFELNTSSTDVIPSYMTIGSNVVSFFENETSPEAGAIIVSREGDNGAHLRSTTSMVKMGEYNDDLLEPAAKTTAVKSYMSASANTDWAEESLQ